MTAEPQKQKVEAGGNRRCGIKRLEPNTACFAQRVRKLFNVKELRDFALKESAQEHENIGSISSLE